MQLKLISPSNISLKGGSGAELELIELGGKTFISKTIIGSEEKASKLNLQYEWLSKRQHSSHIAKVDNLVRQAGYCQYLLNYYENYIPLHIFLAKNKTEVIESTLENLLNFLTEEIYLSRIKVHSEETFLLYLKTKLQNKIFECTKKSGDFNLFLQHDEIEINGKTYHNFLSCFRQIIGSRRIIRANSNFTQSEIHGDMTFENILIDPDTKHFILIDPNVDNAVSGPLIDFSKLMQSGHSKYEYLKEIQKVSIKKNQINFDVAGHSAEEKILLKCLKNRLSEQEMVNLYLYEAIHFSRMLPYKIEQTPHTFMLYYSQLIILLNNYLYLFNKNK